MNDQDESVWTPTVMAWLLVPVALYVALGFGEGLFGGQPKFYPRTADGPGGYLDHEYNQQRNLSQTGVHDVQIPFSVRVEYAHKHGIEPPKR